MGLISNTFKAAQQLKNTLDRRTDSDAPNEIQPQIKVNSDNEFIFQNKVWSDEQIQAFNENVTKVYNERVKLYSTRRKTRAKLIGLLFASGLFSLIFLITFVITQLINGKYTAVVVFGSITLLLFALFVKSLLSLRKIKIQLAKTTVSLDLSSISDDLKLKFISAAEEWKNVYASDAVYYIMATKALSRDQQINQRTTAGTSITRVQVNSKISFINRFLSNMNYDPFIETGFEPIVATTRGNGSLVIFPGFIIAMYDNKLLEPNHIMVYSWECLKIKKDRTTFIETDLFPPKDAKIISYTYEHANIDGTMDRRFASNRQIPIMEYGLITFNNMGTIYEFMISNFSQSNVFYDTIKKLK